jgi:protein-S-isoprenylcysteine O-methyltransferase Ste14
VTTLTEWLARLPAFVLFGGFALFGIALTLALDFVFRRRMQDRTRTEAGRTAAIMLGVLANIYAVLIAFLIVQGWSNLQQAQSYVDSQATALSEIRENSKVLGVKDAAPIDAAAKQYALSVLNDDFPSMEDHGRKSPVTTLALQHLFATVRTVSPRGSAQTAFYDQSVERLDTIVVARQAAATASDGSLPAPLYFLLGLGGVVVIALASVLDSKHRRSHVIIVCSIAVVIAFMLALVVSFDHPFTGTIAVSDRPIREFVLSPSTP